MSVIPYSRYFFFWGGGGGGGGDDFHVFHGQVGFTKILPVQNACIQIELHAHSLVHVGAAVFLSYPTS